MVKRLNDSSDESENYVPNPGRTPEENENNMIALAITEAERRIRNGTASSQIVCHYLKLGSTKERLEKEILEKQRELLEAKTEALKSARRIEELYSDAIRAMSIYQGQERDDTYDEDLY